MRPASPQQTLFEMHPVGTEPPIADRKITPGCLLPAPVNQYVDAKRASRILAADDSILRKLLDKELVTGYKLGAAGRWNIVYSSIVEFCDRLRIQHAIRDRRPKIAPGRRWHDEDILPFPILDTVSVKDAMHGLDAGKQTVLLLIEEGAFEAYQFYPHAEWRISKTSLFEYGNRLKTRRRP